jgi:hypothetical protein
MKKRYIDVIGFDLLFITLPICKLFNIVTVPWLITFLPMLLIAGVAIFRENILLVKMCKQKSYSSKYFINSNSEVVDAIQYTGENESEISDCLRANVCIKTENGLLINTQNGWERADVNDYIVKNKNGECYPCKPDIFKKIYIKLP